jgi:transcriptional regulator with GAF, ATPase, and Fis domain
MPSSTQSAETRPVPTSDPMLKRNHKSSRVTVATRNGREMSRLTRTAFVQCLEESGVSVRGAARLLGCSKSTIERWRRDGFVVPPLRSKKLALCFAKNLHALVAEISEAGL